MRRITLAAAVFAVASAAIAQTPSTPPAPTAPIAVQDPLNMVISRTTLQAIAKGVMKLPYEEAAPILNDLQAQLNKADQAAVEDAKKLEAEKAKAAAPPAAPAAPPAAAPPAPAK